MYVFFLGVVPTMSLLAFFIYYWRQNRPFKSFRKPSSNVYVPTTTTRESSSTRKAKLQITVSKLISSTNPYILSNSTELHI